MTELISAVSFAASARNFTVRDGVLGTDGLKLQVNADADAEHTEHFPVPVEVTQELPHALSVE